MSPNLSAPSTSTPARRTESKSGRTMCRCRIGRESSSARSIPTPVTPISRRRKPSFSPTREATLASQRPAPWRGRGRRPSLARVRARNSCSEEEAMAMMEESAGFVTSAVIFRHERTRRRRWWCLLVDIRERARLETGDVGLIDG